MIQVGPKGKKLRHHCRLGSSARLCCEPEMGGRRRQDEQKGIGVGLERAL